MTRAPDRKPTLLNNMLTVCQEENMSVFIPSTLLKVIMCLSLFLWYIYMYFYWLMNF